MGKTASTTWKSFERRVAKMFGVERNSKSGLGEPIPDIIAAVPPMKKTRIFLSIECKIRGSIPKFLREVMEQIEKSSKIGYSPIAIVKEKSKQDKDSYVFMRLSTFKQFFDLKEGAGAEIEIVPDSKSKIFSA